MLNFESQTLTKNVMYILVDAWHFVLSFLISVIFLAQFISCGSGIICGHQYCCGSFKLKIHSVFCIRLLYIL